MTARLTEGKSRNVALIPAIAALAVAAALAGGGARALAAPHLAAASATENAGTHRSARPGRTGASEPPGRQWASLAYDPAQQDVVLFGGNDSDTVFGDTWTFDGRTWTERHPATSPSARTGAAIAYDKRTHQLLLFGGSTGPNDSGSFLARTWTWNGRSWTRLHPATSPPGRHNADMIYDPATHDVVLFGGYDGSYLNDTWTWNGSTWTQLHPAASPSPRDTDSLAYDPQRKTAILFGGFGDSGRTGDTWAWNGRNWTQRHPATSPGVVSTAWQAAWDGASKQLVLFGGDPGSGFFSNMTWAWNGTNWTQQHPATSPAPRAYGSMVYDQALHRLVLFAGSTGFDFTGPFPRTTWEWNGRIWLRG